MCCVKKDRYLVCMLHASRADCFACFMHAAFAQKACNCTILRVGESLICSNIGVVEVQYKKINNDNRNAFQLMMS